MPDKTLMNAIQALSGLGQQTWLDNLSRSLIESGALAGLLAQGVSGITTNPAIFQKAIADGRLYADDLARISAITSDAEARYEALVIPDVQAACDLLHPLWLKTGGEAGYVSLEVSPSLAHDASGTVAAGQRLAAAVARPNLLIKVPATTAGLLAIEALIESGISVNVTLMFSLRHINAVATAYLNGLSRRVADGGDPSAIVSVASLFLSRVDTAVDRKLTESNPRHPLAGQAAVALARCAYQRMRALFDTESFAALSERGARAQKLLLASTGTKNPAYPDLLYVEPLMGPGVVNTLPDPTLAALLDHGKVAETITCDTEAASSTLKQLGEAGIDLDELGETLQQDGLTLFDEAFAALLNQVGQVPRG